MLLFSVGDRLEDHRDLVETFFPRGLGHIGIHVGVFMGFTGNRGLEIVGGRADGLAGGGIAGLFQIFEMTMGMAGLAFGGGTEHR